MGRQNHLIQKEILELTIPDKDIAMHVQDQFSGLMKEKINPSLDKLFSALAGEDEIIRIDKLIIDIGTVNLNKIKSDIPEQIISVIEDELIAILNEKKTLPKREWVDTNRVKSKVVQASRKPLGLLIFFLQKGYFPWWNDNSGLTKPEDVLENVSRLSKAGLETDLLPVLKKEIPRQRLILQFAESKVRALLIKLDRDFFETAEKLFHSATATVLTDDIKKVLTPSFYSVCLRKIAAGEKINSEEEKTSFWSELLYEAFIHQQEKKGATVISGIIEKAVTFLKTEKITSKDDLLFFNALAGFKTSVGGAGLKYDMQFPSKAEVLLNTSEAKSSESIDLINRLKEQEEKIKLNPGKDESKTLTKSPPLFSEEDDIQVFNAGLVLLHQLLPYFFDGMKLLDEMLQFKDDDSVVKAVHLLQFIVTGKEDHEESKLALNKVLCGMDITMPVPKNLSLTQEEKRECIHLMETVLKRWEALKTTNPETLRQTYLVREGILKRSGAGWKLTVERNAFDVMLEKLPWQISIVKLPWNPEILYVEW